MNPQFFSPNLRGRILLSWVAALTMLLTQNGCAQAPVAAAPKTADEAPRQLEAGTREATPSVVSEQQAVAVPQTAGGSGFRIAIDVGHSLKSPGAGSARGLGEFYFNQVIAKQLDASLRSQGYETVFINADGKIAGLFDRTKLAQKADADLFVSIHHDSCHNMFKKKWIVDGKEQEYADQFSGFSLFFSKRNPEWQASANLASAIGEAMLSAAFKPTHHHAADVDGERRELVEPRVGVYNFPDLIVLHSAGMPAVLVECGVIVNRDEELELKDPAVQKRIVDSISSGLNAYVQSNGQAAKAIEEKVGGEAGPIEESAVKAP